MRFFKLWWSWSLKNEISSPKIFFFLKFVFGISIGCMGTSKRCFGSGGCLGIHLEIWIFFDFFKQKMKDFLMFWLDFWAWGCKINFLKNQSLIKKSDRQIFSFGPILWPPSMVGHKIKFGKKFCPLNFAQKCVFSSFESLEAWKMKF